jgi:flagellar motor switch protein FliG
MSAPVRALTLDSLSGSQKCAILCMALGPEGAAAILQRLAPDQVEEVTREIATLPPIDAELAKAEIEQGRAAAEAAMGRPRGGIDFAHRVLTQALGEPAAKSVIEKVQEQTQEAALRRLRRLPLDMLRGLLQGEHPQAIAVVLAHLEARQAADLAAALGPEIAADVLSRMARTDKVSADVITLIDEILSRAVDPTLVRPTSASGGPGAVARLINHASGNGAQLLQGLQDKSPELAERVQNLMFVFEDLLLVDNKGMQRLLREIDTKDLALGLKAASPDLRQHVRSAMSERAAGALEEEMEILGSVRVKDVEAVHARIIEHVRALETAGEISIRGRGGDDDVLA